MNLTELSKSVHQANIKWWQDIDTGLPIKRNRLELLSLVISEISECLEGERKNLMDDKLPHRKMAEVEMADAYIRLLDFAAGFDIRLNEPAPVHHYAVPDNKGEALFRLTKMVVNIKGFPETWLDEAFGFIRAYCAKHGYDLEGAMAEKMAFNATRQDHTHEARRIAGGKGF